MPTRSTRAASPVRNLKPSVTRRHPVPSGPPWILWDGRSATKWSSARPRNTPICSNGPRTYCLTPSPTARSKRSMCGRCASWSSGSKSRSTAPHAESRQLQGRAQKSRWQQRLPQQRSRQQSRGHPKARTMHTLRASAIDGGGRATCGARCVTVMAGSAPMSTSGGNGVANPVSRVAPRARPRIRRRARRCQSHDPLSGAQRTGRRTRLRSRVHGSMLRQAAVVIRALSPRRVVGLGNLDSNQDLQSQSLPT